MTVIEITLRDEKRVLRALKTAPRRMILASHQAVEKIITKIERDAKRNAPVNKQGGGGNLRQSIRSKMTGPARGEIRAGANYAAAVHDGTRPHIIRIKRKKVLANRRAGQIFGKVVNHPGTRGQPFMADAVNSNLQYIDKQFGKAVEKVLRY